jgi:hypothetical protein
MTGARTFALLAMLVAATAAADVVDNCASLLGSLGVEHRFARQLPRDGRTTFTCPRDTRALIGASRQRVLAALGSPDETAPGSDGASVAWTYWFGPPPSAGAERATGQPGLRFDFDGAFEVLAVDCRRHP